MIRRLVALLLIAAPAIAGEQHTFARNYNLKIPAVAATTNYIVTSTNVVNSTYMLAHQPDAPRNVTGTVIDTTPSITAGTITFAGTDVNGASQTEVWNLAGPTLTFTGAKLFATITSITGAAIVTLGGAGDETIVIGVGSSVGYLYCTTSDPIGGLSRLKTSGSSTTVTPVNGNPTFGAMSAGDDIIVNTSPTTTQRRAVSSIAADGSSIVIDSAADWSNGTSGYTFTWRHVACGYSDSDGWQNASAIRDENVKVETGDGSGAALNAVGGLAVSVECRFTGDGTSPAQVIGTNLTGVLRPLHSFVFPIKESCGSVRVGLKWGTNYTSGTNAVSAYQIGNDIGPTH